MVFYSVVLGVVYDALGRVTDVTGPLGAFSYGYDGLTGRLLSVNGPGGLRRLYSYFDLAGDRRRREIRSGQGRIKKDTPFGSRDLDAEVLDANGNPLGGIEAELPDARYPPTQQAKDNWLKMQGHPVNVVRPPSGCCPKR